MEKNLVNTDYATAWAVGGIFGIMHGVILYSSMLTLSTASYMIYKDAYKVPIMLTLLVDVVVLIGVVTAGGEQEPFGTNPRQNSDRIVSIKGFTFTSEISPMGFYNGMILQIR